MMLLVALLESSFVAPAAAILWSIVDVFCCILL